MTTRERFHALMTFGSADSLPFIEWAPWWDLTLERWRREGLPAELVGDGEIRRWFGLEEYHQFWPLPRTAEFCEEGKEGFTTIRTVKEYERILPRLFAEPSFDEGELRRAARAQAAGEEVIWLTLDGYFWFPRTLFGIEGHLYAFYDHPELMDRMNRDLHKWHLKTLEEFCRFCVPDFVTIAEDMTYNHGPMIGRELFDRHLLPWYRRLIPELSSRGILPFVDTDGNVMEMIPWLKEAGFRGSLPLERQAGSDPRLIRRLHPDWLMIGGVDKRKLSGPRDVLIKELTEAAELAREGGYIPGIDHQTPPEVSLEEYRRYLAMMREIYTFSRAKRGGTHGE